MGRVTRMLIWLSLRRPDLSYSVKELGAVVSKPTASAEAGMKRCLRYIQHSKGWIWQMCLEKNQPASFHHSQKVLRFER